MTDLDQEYLKPENQKLIKFAEEKVLEICGLLEAGPSDIKQPVNYVAFLEREMASPERVNYENAKFAFTDMQMHVLQRYILKKYSVQLQHYNFTLKVKMVMEICDHLCFLYTNTPH